jgi:hypothetical protein
MNELRIKKPWGEIVIPSKVVKRIRRHMGQEGVNLFQLLCELADEKGQVRFDGNPDQVGQTIAALYEARFGDAADA